MTFKARLAIAAALASALATGCSSSREAQVLPPRPADIAPSASGPYNPAAPGPAAPGSAAPGPAAPGLAPLGAGQPFAGGGQQFAGGGACNEAAAQSVIGQLGNVEASDAAKAASGAETVRVTYPNQPLAQDVDPNRLTLATDNQNRIVSARCG